MLSLVVIASAITAMFFWYVQAPVGYARIYKSNELIEVVDLTTLTESLLIMVESENKLAGSGYNQLQAEQGRIRMAEADCPDGICVRQGWVSGNLIPIICLPNNVVVILESSDNNVDAVVG